ncbi:MAG: transporter [Proteobacteria bacterium]|nr:transporter [Pseudomonadota bacterium]
MKQLNNILTAVFLAVSVGSFVGCASTATQEGTGEYFDDAWITTKVKAALVDDPLTKSYQISVETFKGVVQLSGFVATQAEASKAAELARGVKGVTSVKNDLRLK